MIFWESNDLLAPNCTINTSSSFGDQSLNDFSEKFLSIKDKPPTLLNIMMLPSTL